MALWNKLRQELDRAGKVAQGALDEGRLRLEAFRARQRADKSARVLGYAVYRARKSGLEVEAETYARLASEIAGHEADAARFEAEADALVGGRGPSTEPTSPSTPSGTESSPPPPA